MNTLIKLNKVSVSYNGIDAINDISIQINNGDFVSIIGPNGGGKTTLLNTILGFLKCSSGEVEFINKNLNISYVPQISSIDRNFPISALDTVLTAFLKKGLHPFRSFSKAETIKAFGFLKDVALEQYANRQISELSGGEFQRLLIARALAAEPEIIFLDEPTASIDTVSKNKIFKIISDLNLNGITVVLVTHDLAAACKHSSKLICINHELIYCGEPKITDKIHSLICGCNLNGGDIVD